jgi:uncharacterized protein (DUF305 family)
VKRLLAALLMPLLLAACGTDSPPAQPPRNTAAAQHNDSDVMFLQMLAHHQKQGLQMTATAAQRAHDPQLKTLAAAVQATEKDELTMIESWLKGWGEPIDVGTAASLHADHGGLPGTGTAEIEALTKAPAASFDKAFLNLFLAHQHQAVEMAQLAKDRGANPETKAFAERVRQSRQGEIQQMLKLMN